MGEPSGFDEGSILLEYLPRLIGLAEHNMSSQLRQKIGADDIANSVLGSIVRMNREGKLPLCIEESEYFWKYLIVVSLHKIRKKARFYSAKKRSISLEIPMDKVESMVRDQRGDPSEEGARRVALILEQLDSWLDKDGKVVMNGRLSGLPNTQIAAQLNDGQGMSTKAVTRKWNAIEQKLHQLVEEIDFGE